MITNSRPQVQKQEVKGYARAAATDDFHYADYFHLII